MTLKKSKKILKNKSNSKLDLVNSSQLQVGKEKHTKTLIIVIIAFIFILSLSVIFLSRNSNDKDLIEDIKLSIVCSDNNKLLDKASRAIKSEDLASLATLEKEILMNDNYNRDPDCLLILVKYSIFKSDADTAEIYLSSLIEVYPLTEGYTKPLSESGNKPEDLTQVVKFLKEQKANFEENTYLGGTKRDE